MGDCSLNYQGLENKIYVLSVIALEKNIVI